MIEKPLVTVSGKKILFKSDLHRRLTQDLPQEGLEWRRRLDSNSKSVYIDIDFVDFDIDNVERSSERLSRMSLEPDTQIHVEQTKPNYIQPADNSEFSPDINESVDVNIEEEPRLHADLSEEDAKTETKRLASQIQDDLNEFQQAEASRAFFNRKLLGTPILHTYWADKTDFEGDDKKAQFDDWIGQVQASNCTEWAIIIIEDGDLKAQLGTALFKSKLQSSSSQANTSSSSISGLTHNSSAAGSFLDRMKKGLSTIFQSDSNSDRWLTLINQNRLPDNKAQESYSNFLRKFRAIVMASFSKQIELFEEQLRVQREMRTDKSWDFLSYFSMQEELAFAFEFLTLFDEALVQYNLLDALFTEYITSSAFNENEDPLYCEWTKFQSWPGLCLDTNSSHSKQLRQQIISRKASLLDMRNYLFAKQCDLMLMQNEPWRVAASTVIFLQNCIHEHEFLKINCLPGALTCWGFISALEVLQKCECYSCTSTMENYSLHTVDIWNSARKKLTELGYLCDLMPNSRTDSHRSERVTELIAGLGSDPHRGASYQSNQISPYARLVDALVGKEQFATHLIEMTELTLGTYKHIGRKRQAQLVGKELADFYVSQNKFTSALPFYIDLEKTFSVERWQPLLDDVRRCISQCKSSAKDDNLEIHDCKQTEGTIEASA